MGDIPMLANWVQIEMGKSFKTIKIDHNFKNYLAIKLSHSFLCNVDIFKV
jgi:hypothetical protein